MILEFHVSHGLGALGHRPRPKGSGVPDRKRKTQVGRTSSHAETRRIRRSGLSFDQTGFSLAREIVLNGRVDWQGFIRRNGRFR